MAIILNIETATKNCSVSISKNGKQIALKEINDGNYSHGENLHVFIEDLILETKLSLQDFNAIAVSKGPGSFTGLRIGVSSAKGLCFSLNIPLISISTLACLANALKVENEAVIIPLLDARRMEVYSSVFNNKHEQIRDIQAQIIDENSFSTYLDTSKVYFLGDGAAKCKDILVHKNAIFLDGYFPSAKQMLALSFDKFQNNNFEDVAYFEPFYLKDFLVTPAKKII